MNREALPVGGNELKQSNFYNKWEDDQAIAAEIKEKATKRTFKGYLWQVVRALILSIPSVIIASVDGTSWQPAILTGICSFIANFALNFVYDSVKANKYATKAKHRLQKLPLLVKGFILLDTIGGILACGLALGALTEKAFEDDILKHKPRVWHEQMGTWLCLLVALFAAIYQRGNGAAGVFAKISIENIRKKWNTSILDKADFVVSFFHFLIGIFIWLDMYTPKGFSGLNKLLELFSFKNLICNEKDCDIAIGWKIFFAYLAKWNLIFFCWAARSPLTTTRDFGNFFLQSDFAKKQQGYSYKGFVVSIVMLGLALSLVSFYSVHGLIVADIDGREKDTASLNNGFFDAPELQIVIFGYYFFVLVNLIPTYTAIPAIFSKFGFFKNSESDSKSFPMRTFANGSINSPPPVEEDEILEEKTSIFATCFSFLKGSSSSVVNERTPLTSRQGMLSPTSPAVVV